MNFLARTIKVTVIVAIAVQTAFANCADCTTLEFGKKLQLSPLLPLFSMNTKEKLQYISNQGIALFQFSEQKAPSSAGLLPTPPETIRHQYQQHFSEEGVLGIYLTERLARNGVACPTILLVDHADDWTITHEFMHYLFDRARALEDPRSESLIVNNMSDAKEDFFSDWEKYKNLNRYVDQKHKMTTIENFVTFTNLQVQILLSFVLEEVTIEKFLGLAFLKSKPVGLEQDAYTHSLIYIRDSGRSSLRQLQIILDSCIELKTSLEESDEPLRLSLNRVCSGVEQHKNSLLKIGQELNINFENR